MGPTCSASTAWPSWSSSPSRSSKVRGCLSTASQSGVEGRASRSPAILPRRLRDCAFLPCWWLRLTSPCLLSPLSPRRPPEVEELWIGLNDLKLQMNFEWSDGSLVSFTHWHPFEPNNFRDSLEDCVTIWGPVRLPLPITGPLIHPNLPVLPQSYNRLLPVTPSHGLSEAPTSPPTTSTRRDCQCLTPVSSPNLLDHLGQVT